VRHIFLIRRCTQLSTIPALHNFARNKILITVLVVTDLPFDLHLRRLMCAPHKMSATRPAAARVEEPKFATHQEHVRTMHNPTLR
jgi:hypothetical protein